MKHVSRSAHDDALDDAALYSAHDDRNAQSWRQAAAGRAKDAVASSADYLREQDFDEIRSEIEGRVRERPLASLLIAAAAGFIIARMFRD